MHTAGSNSALNGSLSATTRLGRDASTSYSEAGVHEPSGGITGMHAFWFHQFYSPRGTGITT
jgi:hypothetical protein